MNRERDSPRHDGTSSNWNSRQSSSITTSNGATGSISHEEKEPLSSISHSSSPKITSILLPPSESSAIRPRSSEGRVTSLNLPKHSSQRSHIQSLGTSRRRTVNNHGVNKYDQEGPSDMKPNERATGDAILNFGLSYELGLEPEDPKVLEDVQKALQVKALRESRSRLDATRSPLKDQKSDSLDPPLNVNVDIQALPVTLPQHVNSSADRVSPSSAILSKVIFPSYVHSPSRSLETISSGSSPRSPVPVLLSSKNGTTCLDWSGALPPRAFPEKRTSLLGRTLSLTKRKPKEKDLVTSIKGRNSFDFGASQGDLYIATLDSIRRTARRDTVARAEKTKNELGRRYASLNCYKPTGEPVLNILDVIKARPDDTDVQTPWLSWCRRRTLIRHQSSLWIVTADSIDEYLQASGHVLTRSSVATSSAPGNMLGARTHSPTYGFPSSSPRSSLSNNPLPISGPAHKDDKRVELSRSFSSIPVVFGVSSSSPPRSHPLSRSLSLTLATPTGKQAEPVFQQRRSIDDAVANEHGTIGFTSTKDSPRSSLDRGSELQPLSPLSDVEKGSKKRKFLSPLSAEKTVSSPGSRRSTVSSIANLLVPSPSHGVHPPSGRLHLGVGNMLNRMRRSVDEAAGNIYVRPRSSVSDEHDSTREGEGTKSDDATGTKGAGFTPVIPGSDFRGIMSRKKEASNTSESEVGVPTSRQVTARIGDTFQKSSNDYEKDQSAEDGLADLARGSISGEEQRQADAWAGLRWTSRRGMRHARMSALKEVGSEELQELLRKQEEEEESEKVVYEARELLLVEANDRNRRIARLLKTVCTLIRDHEDIQAELAEIVGLQYKAIPPEVLDAISADPASTLRHGKGCHAVEDSHRRFNDQQNLLKSYILAFANPSRQDCSSDLGHSIHKAEELWRGLRVKSERIENQAMVAEPALERAGFHVGSLQKEYNDSRILVETDYPEQTRIMDLGMIITESRAPRGWLAFAAVWIPEHVLEFIGGFIRFFGVPISEKFIRPFLWYFFRNRYYWKIYSTEPPPSERAWYTRLAYWIVILSILAWYSTA